MKVLLLCVSCECVGYKRYRARMSPVVEKGQPNLPDHIVELDCPAVPGKMYELLMKGVYPGHANDRPCVGGVLSFHQTGGCKLDAVSLEREAELERIATYGRAD